MVTVQSLLGSGMVEQQQPPLPTVGKGTRGLVGHALLLPVKGVTYAGDRLHTLVTTVGDATRFLHLRKSGEVSSVEKNSEERETSGGAYHRTALYKLFQERCNKHVLYVYSTRLFARKPVNSKRLSALALPARCRSETVAKNALRHSCPVDNVSEL